MSSSLRAFQVIPKSAAVAATVLHNGTNGQGYPPHLEGFVVQTFDADVHFGESTVTGETDGYTVKADTAVNITGFLSRGSPFAYDLTKIFYIGGAWKLVIERQT